MELVAKAEGARGGGWALDTPHTGPAASHSQRAVWRGQTRLISFTIGIVLARPRRPWLAIYRPNLRPVPSFLSRRPRLTHVARPSGPSGHLQRAHHNACSLPFCILRLKTHIPHSMHINSITTSNLAISYKSVA